MAPAMTARVGQRGSQLGLIELGGPRGPLFPTIQAPTIPATATALIARVYNNAMTTYKGSLTLLNRPKLKWSLNGGYESITLLTQTPVTSSLYGAPTYGGPTYGGVGLGDVVQVTEQGGTAVIYTGILEQTSDTYDNPATFGLVLTPLVSELGDTGFSINYATATDISDMVRDAVASTLHLKYNNFTIPDTGQFGQYDFSSTNCLDVLNVARLMAGVNYYWFVDAVGYVWFQFTGAAAEHTLTQMQQYTSRTKTPDITKLKNDFLVIGGIPVGSSTGPITSSYVGASTAQYGPRTIMPPPTFPTVTDQSSLNLLAATLGGVLDRTINRTDMVVANYPTPIVPDRPGGPMLRYWEPAKLPLQEQARGSGNYSPAYVVLENERDGPIQKIKAGDIPINTVDDLKYMLDRIVMRLAVQPANQPPFVGTNVVQLGSSASLQGANGSALVDSLGLVSAAVSTLVGATNFTSTDATVIGAWITVTGSTIVFTVPRQQTFVAFYAVHGWMAVGVETGQVRMNINGTVSQRMTFASTSADTSASGFLTITLPAGTYTASTEISLQGGAGTAHMHEGENILLRLGS